jgi:hypothetical protein
MAGSERQRLEETRTGVSDWKKWGPYLSDRAWGTVREDYSADGNAWNFFSHDQARSRAYLWGEDGIGGISDDRQQLCFALSLWNEADPILKERYFGLTNSEGNHGEDVKEYYFYLDSTPTHSYMKFLYKYPQTAFPYDELVQANRQRGRSELEYELLNTGVFDEGKYFDVFVEYAKADPNDVLILITAYNRAKSPAPLHIVPTLWFRNTWSAGHESKPQLSSIRENGAPMIAAQHPELGEYRLHFDGRAERLFTENETNTRRIYGVEGGQFAKDGINDYVVSGRWDAVKHENVGTKAAVHYKFMVPAQGNVSVRLRLRSVMAKVDEPFTNFDETFKRRKYETDEFYEEIIPKKLSRDGANVMRQALAGMLWTKQFYYFDVGKWIDQHGGRDVCRNKQWFHMMNSDIISVPDKWEYPWYAAWDLAFHTIPLAVVDLDFAKRQLDLLVSDVYMHPNGQLPAYEWNFSDVNPPVHAWATLNLVSIEKEQRGAPDYAFLKSMFNKLMLNFTWWVNRKDAHGANVFEGGFLGLDNIGIFDRSSPIPGGGYLEQADGTAWMALFSQNMLQIALELCKNDSTYIDMALKFIEHFFWIAAAMDKIGDNEQELWDETDGFFYDLLRFPDGRAQRLKLRSMVGLLPLCATTVLEKGVAERFPETLIRVRSFLERHQTQLQNIAPPTKPGVRGRLLLAILNEDKLRRVLSRMLDENEFLSEYGIRSLSRCYLENPYGMDVGGTHFQVEYLPAESDTGMFGGNSNWRGPIWVPVNLLILRALHQFYLYYGDDFKVECPTRSGNMKTLFEVAQDISGRLCNIFLRSQNGRRPLYGETSIFQEDPNWRDLILFYEYFHGDNGAGIGASHQTGWSGAIARLLQLQTQLSKEDVLSSSNIVEAFSKTSKAA